MQALIGFVRFLKDPQYSGIPLLPERRQSLLEIEAHLANSGKWFYYADKVQLIRRKFTRATDFSKPLATCQHVFDNDRVQNRAAEMMRQMSDPDFVALLQTYKGCLVKAPETVRKLYRFAMNFIIAYCIYKNCRRPGELENLTVEEYDKSVFCNYRISPNNCRLTNNKRWNSISFMIDLYSI